MPAIGVRTLAAVLVPWTVMRAAVPGRFFPSEAIRWAWVVFDAGLFVALWALVLRSH